MINVKPGFGAFVLTSSCPPCASIIDFDIGSPIPIPFGFVVKNASNIFSVSIAGAMGVEYDLLYLDGLAHDRRDGHHAARAELNSVRLSLRRNNPDGVRKDCADIQLAKRDVACASAVAICPMELRREATDSSR